jgi:ATP-binding cassette subfamily B protein
MNEEMLGHMVGHRTRLAQQPPDEWHVEEDRGLAHYLRQAQALDSEEVALSLVPRAFLVLALAALLPAYAFSQGGSPGALAISLGGVLLAYRGLRQVAAAGVSLVGAVVSWRAVAPLVGPARAEERGVPGLNDLDRSGAQSSEAPLIEAERLSFRYPGRSEPVLRECGLVIRRGDRILLEGASGSGKSTLASLLAGLQEPESGLILLRGMDRGSFGIEAWRRRVATAPQFHENYVFVGSFAFNLLLGRRWPPRLEDLAEAERLCEALGLGDLLSRMPGGLWQTVGDSGWQLSHGERSRLYIARALLQGGDLLILDESFAALDPETLERALRTVLERAPALLVIAHP